MKKLLKPIYHFLASIGYRCRCLRLGIKYKKGVVIRRGVTKDRGTKVVLSKDCGIGRNTCFWGGGTIILGENTHIASYSSIYASKEGGIVFGDNVNCARNLFCIDANHSYTDKNILICKQPLEVEKVVIGNNCWIGANVTIIKGASIGNGCVIGACTLVNKKFPDNVVVCGIPGKIVKNR